jgi:hypothetical protein
MMEIIDQEIKGHSSLGKFLLTVVQSSHSRLVLSKILQIKILNHKFTGSNWV